MTVGHSPFLGTAYLRSVWFDAYQAYCGSSQDKDLIKRLRHWSDRRDLKETSAEIAFVTQFFQETWGYHGSGQSAAASGYTMHPKYPIAGAGAGGGTGTADLALGWFDRAGVPGTPQVLCEFKDIRSKLDAPQQRKGSKRTPVKQACDYLAAARRGLFGNESVRPTWAIVSDMNEFRLYWYDGMPHQFLRFVIRPEELFQGRSLLADGDEARFERFLFHQIFQREMLLTTGGRCALEDLIATQRFRERAIENEFYQEYSEFRERLYNTLVSHNPRFVGTRSQLVRVAQSILDRCIFILYCEDMGQGLRFPPQLLRDFLMERSRDPYFAQEGGEVWEGLQRLFDALDRGGGFARHRLNAFNGGLFQRNETLHSLRVPNYVFCEKSQGDTEANIRATPYNLLYLSASYNFAAKSDGSKSLGLYTLGRIFEQSITELEIREAEVDGRPSIGKITKRKRDGVYYTPEWVVATIVDDTLGRRLEELKHEAGWIAARNQGEEVAAVGRYLELVKQGEEISWLMTLSRQVWRKGRLKSSPLTLRTTRLPPPICRR